MTIEATFLVDCDQCSAKVAARQEGKAESMGFDQEENEGWGARILVGHCPHCKTLVAAHQTQIDFEGLTAEFDDWSEPIRVFPNPPKTFSQHIPKVVRASITEAQKCIHAGANTAACVMLRRTMEAICLDVLKPLRAKELADAKESATTPKKYRKQLMLGEGLKELYERKIIDERLFTWSRQIQVVGNQSAHAVDIDISRQDATDLMSFVTALIEYIFDLTLRYNQFLLRSTSGSSFAMAEEVPESDLSI